MSDPFPWKLHSKVDDSVDLYMVKCLMGRLKHAPPDKLYGR